MRSVLITGATGFLGSAIVRQSLVAGLAVRTTDRLHASEAGSLPDYRKADILSPETLAPVMDGAGAVVHAAGLAHVFGDESRAPFVPVNVEGTANVVRAAIEAGSRHLVLVSSVSVYGRSKERLCDETGTCRPEGPYAESKYEAERQAIQLAEEADLKLTILRLATAYGEGDRGNVARLIHAIDRGRFVWVGSGRNRKSLIHRDDVGRACAAVLRQPPEGVEVYNLSATPCTMREVVQGIADALDRPVPRWEIPSALALGATRWGARLLGEGSRPGRIHRALRKWLAEDLIDAGKFQRAYSFQPGGGLSEGLRREVEWYRTEKAGTVR